MTKPPATALGANCSTASRVISRVHDDGGACRARQAIPRPAAIALRIAAPTQSARYAGRSAIGSVIQIDWYTAAPIASRPENATGAAR